MELTPEQIYLADQRGISENDRSICWSTLNYGQYQHPERQAYGTLLTLNDELFMPGYQDDYHTGQAVWVVIIPITGEVVYQPASGKPLTIDVGHVYVNYVPGGTAFKLINPYVDDRINFLYLEFKAGELSLTGDTVHLYDFSFKDQENQLIPVNIFDSSPNLPFTLHIGQFGGREEAVFQPENSDSLFFTFVIAGAFELQGRLLHQRDGLALWNLKEADMEALSNNAVILVMEIKKQA